MEAAKHFARLSRYASCTNESVEEVSVDILRQLYNI